MPRFVLFVCLALSACVGGQKLPTPHAAGLHRSGSAFYKAVNALGWKDYDSAVKAEILSGNMPSFLKKAVAVNSTIIDSATGKQHQATFFVCPDYLSVGNDEDWARVPMTPMAAQEIADSLRCFLPKRKMVDLIYTAADVKLEPVPLFAFRDSSPTFYHHHLIIEGQRQGRAGLIAGIKKDVVISSRLAREPQPARVAIYGWHQLNGKPIQPLYSRHLNWYVDYSHGIRLVLQQVRVDGHWMNYRDVMQDPMLRRLLCDEDDCGFLRYP